MSSSSLEVRLAISGDVMKIKRTIVGHVVNVSCRIFENKVYDVRVILMYSVLLPKMYHVSVSHLLHPNLTLGNV